MAAFESIGLSLLFHIFFHESHESIALKFLL